MELKVSRVKKRLKEGKVCFGTMLRILESPQAIALCALQGWDYISMDTEHNDYNHETLGSFSLTAKYEDIGLFVRVPDKLYHQMVQTLNIGAGGIVLPQVKTREETEHIIRSTKYAPMGRRGVSISNIVTQFRDYDMETYAQWANEHLMVIIQIESEQGVNNLDAIMAVDAVMIGLSDLSQDIGIPGQLHHPRMEEAFRKVIKSCNKYGVAPGVYLQQMGQVSKWIGEGIRFITYNYNINFFKEASRDVLQHLRSFV